MKLKSLLFVCCLSLLSSAFATNRHGHAEAGNAADANSATKGAMTPGFCEIEVFNYTNDPVTVWGNFIDQSELQAFTAYPYRPEYVTLFYRGYCQPKMALKISSGITGQLLYPAYWQDYYTYVGQTVEVSYPYQNKAKIEIRAK